MKMAFNLLKMQPFRYCSYMRKVFRFLTLQGDNVDRVLRCLWIYINTGIKNELEGTKTI